MELATRLADLQKRATEHREVLLTEEAAKTALVMPFIQALGYDVFNPSEVVPEFTCDVGTKKGEKVDYAVCREGKVSILVECKPVSIALNINHASQLFRYFSVTEARLAILTNGVVYQFYSDIEQPNKMDEKPFFTFSLDALKQSDTRIIERFTKPAFDIDLIVQEAAGLKIQSQLRLEIEKEFSAPSDEFVTMLARRIHDGRLTPAIRENFSKHVAAAINSIVRELVTERLSSALKVSEPNDIPDSASAAENSNDEIVTTEEEISGFRIVQAIAAKLVDPKRIHLRDAKSYAAILLDDNNRKSLARLHFNAATVKYVSTFSGKDETRHQISDLADIYQLTNHLETRIQELEV
ncbi:type I restriction endonuclease [Sphingomonas sp. C3-2]|uniref:type I restriction endonuclease n=1 Tax=Sphingomonas sp. C3-2 TaxID=3062169 RepID=UPI00294B79D4|nr:type I restriction endonuclease [Sphingomonas sp. C3-2]WOK36195.1 type I restriction enzyme HsdR N-terminal domain-containing protein [Sphingomonas sp. C3-2]